MSYFPQDDPPAPAYTHLKATAKAGVEFKWKEGKKKFPCLESGVALLNMEP